MNKLIEYTRWDGTTYTTPYDAQTWKDLLTSTRMDIKTAQLIEIEAEEEISQNTYVITIWKNNFTTSSKYTAETNDPMLWVVDRFGPDEFDDFTYQTVTRGTK